jgi:hypothetical protein
MIKASLMQAGCEIDFQRQADIGGGLPPTSPRSKMPNSDLQPLVWSNGLLRPRPHEVSLPGYRISESGVFRCSKCVQSLIDHRLWHPIKQRVSKWQLDQVGDNLG